MLNEYRNTYDNIKRCYEHFGQFQYSDQRDQGQLQTDVYRYCDFGYVNIVSTIEENNSSLVRSIIIFEDGLIIEKEYSSRSKFKRMRVIYKSGLCEECSMHDDTNFGIRKVVYPDGQKFTAEVYDKGWHAIGEETYAILNKSIPYILGNNEMKEYKFVSEDGIFNIIDLR